MLKLSQFKSLTIGMKSDLIRLNGTFLYKKFENDCITFLYAYNNFFIEVKYFEDAATVEFAPFMFDYERIYAYMQHYDMFELSTI